MTASAPSRTAADTAHVIPRSLNEPVGFAPSSLSHTSHARALGHALGQHERRGALGERHHRVAGRERQPLAPALDQPGAR